MTKRTIWSWVLVIVVPLIPVILLYAIFSRLNYFELKDTARGIVAIGPIAAYFVFLCFDLGAMMKLSKITDFSISEKIVNEIKGQWVTESKSIHGNHGSGECSIQSVNGQLVINGHMTENTEIYGSWESKITAMKENKLYIIYSLDQVREENNRLDGVCILICDPSPINEMRGKWTVIGKERMTGEITFKKKKS
ncbi:MAG TPA: hypothetical protein VK469_23015 [Candidatus Kapabacteria bacterium]|nr:hypothetical protein [Candidatus Kapabacteria bacterium]